MCFARDVKSHLSRMLYSIRKMTSSVPTISVKEWVLSIFYALSDSPHMKLVLQIPTHRQKRLQLCLNGAMRAS